MRVQYSCFRAYSETATTQSLSTHNFTLDAIGGKIDSMICNRLRFNCFDRTGSFSVQNLNPHRFSLKAFEGRLKSNNFLAASRPTTGKLDGLRSPNWTRTEALVPVNVLVSQLAITEFDD
jgi:hypothetical protein